MKRTLTLLLLLLNCSLNAQELSAGLVERFELQTGHFVGVDDLGNVYYVNDDILFKKSANRLFSYSNVALGELHSVDIRNPFKIVLFYADFNAVILLDNNLNELTEKIDFTGGTLFNNVRFVTGASQNNLWIYADDNKLHLYDYEGLQELFQTQAMTFYEPEFVASGLVSTYKKAWILSEREILEFNEYGVFTRRYDIEGASGIYPYKKGFFYVKESAIFYRDEKLELPVTMDWDKSFESIYVNSSNIFVYDGTTVYQYQLLR